MKIMERIYILTKGAVKELLKECITEIERIVIK